MAWTGLAWTGPACLAWTGMAWTGLACTGPACLDLDFSSSSPGPPLHLDWTCLPGLDWNGLDWTGLNWTCLSGPGLLLLLPWASTAPGLDLPVWTWTSPPPPLGLHCTWTGPACLAWTGMAWTGQACLSGPGLDLSLTLQCTPRTSSS